MSSGRTHIVKQGETLDILSRQHYGTESYVSLLISANPGIIDPPSVGSTINIPNNPSLPKNINNTIAADSDNQIQILINNKIFRYWSNIRLVRSIDSFDTIYLSAPFDPSDNDLRFFLKPFKFLDIKIFIGTDLIFTGVLLNSDPVIQDNSSVIEITAYSLPAVLNDCSAENLEFNNASLPEITKQIVKPFGINTIVDLKILEPLIFERVSVEIGDSALSFLTKLAKIKNLIITNTADGSLFYTRSINNALPVANLIENESPVIDIKPTLDPQSYYSSIKGIKESDFGGESSSYTVKNKFLNGVFRPFIFSISDLAEGQSVKDAVEAKMARMFGDSISYEITLATIRDASGALFKPNTIIKLLAPSVMIYNSYDFLIKSVSFVKNLNSETTILTLVTKGAYSGEIPSSLPWEE